MPEPDLGLPVGTKVLIRESGHVGVVTQAACSSQKSYCVRFPDGSERKFVRGELTIFKHVTAEIPGGPQAAELERFVIFKCVVGSTAFGLNTEASDVDRRGFYLPPADLHWALAGVPEQLEHRPEECYWEIEKFIRLSLKANPNVLECLYSSLVEVCTPVARPIIEERTIFLSRHVHRTYNSYVLSQFKRLEQDIRNHQAPRWKHVMHLMRLLLAGSTILREGFVPLRMDRYREELLAIRRGEMPWDEVEEWRRALHRKLDAALEESKLPEHPNYQRANELLLQARRAAAAEYGR